MVLIFISKHGGSARGEGGGEGGWECPSWEEWRGIGRGGGVYWVYERGYPVKISYLWGDILCIVCLECCLRT